MLLYVLIAAGVELGHENAGRRVKSESIHCWMKRLHGAKARVSQGAPQAFGCVASLVEMMIVEECIELSMKGLNLCL